MDCELGTFQERKEKNKKLTVFPRDGVTAAPVTAAESEPDDPELELDPDPDPESEVEVGRPNPPV